MHLLKFLEKRPYTILLLLVALVSVYSLKHNFLFIDDLQLIVNNPKLHFSLTEIMAVFSKPLGQIYDAADYQIKFIYYRPALNLLYMLNNAVWGINPVGFHLTNLTLHLLTTIFIYRTGLLLFNNDRSVSLLAAALFSVHPVHNEVISRVAMNENLLGFFIVTSLFFYLKKNKYLSLAAFAMALLSKESAVMFPFALFLLEIKKTELKKSLTSLSPYIKVLGVYLVVRTVVVGIPDVITMNASWAESALTACSALADYIRLLCIPYPLSIFYNKWKFISPFQPDLLLSVAICTLLGYTGWRWRNDRLLFPLLGGTLIMLVPVILKANQLILGAERAFIAERQLYVPAIFFSLLIAGIIVKYVSLPARKYVVSAIICIIPVFIYTTIEMSAVWENDDVLYSRFMRDYSEMSLAHKYRGQILFRQGDLDGALVELEAALPTTSSKPSGAAQTSLRPGKRKFKSLANFFDRYALTAYQPEFAEIHLKIGQIYLLKGETDRAIRKFKAALALQPHYVEARTSLAEVYLKKGLYKDASREFKLALKDINDNRKT